MGSPDGRFPTKNYAQRNYFKGERPFPIQLSRRSPKPSQPFWPQKPAAFCQSPENHTQKPPKWQTDQRQLQVRWRGQPINEPQPKSQPSEDSRQRQPGSVVGRAARTTSAGFLEYELLKPAPKLTDFARKGAGCYSKFLRQHGRCPSDNYSCGHGRSYPALRLSPNLRSLTAVHLPQHLLFKTAVRPTSFLQISQPAPTSLPRKHQNFCRHQNALPGTGAGLAKKVRSKRPFPPTKILSQRANWPTDRPSLAAALPKTRQSAQRPKLGGNPDGRFPTKTYAQRNYFQGERPLPFQLSCRSPKPSQPCRPQKSAACCQSPENRTPKTTQMANRPTPASGALARSAKNESQPKSQSSEDSRQRQPGSVVGRAARTTSAGFLEYELLKPVPRLTDFARKGAGCCPKFLMTHGRCPSDNYSCGHGRFYPALRLSPNLRSLTAVHLPQHLPFKTAVRLPRFLQISQPSPTSLPRKHQNFCHSQATLPGTDAGLAR